MLGPFSRASKDKPGPPQRLRVAIGIDARASRWPQPPWDHAPPCRQAPWPSTPHRPRARRSRRKTAVTNRSGMRRQKLARDHASHRVAVDVGLLDLEVVHEFDHVAGHPRSVFLRIVRLVALPVAAAIDGNDPVLCGQGFGHAVGKPVSAGRARIAVDEHDGLRLSPIACRLRCSGFYAVRGLKFAVRSLECGHRSNGAEQHRQRECDACSWHDKPQDRRGMENPACAPVTHTRLT